MGPPGAKIVATWLGQGRTDSVEANLPAGEAVRFGLPPGRWEFSAEAPGFWSEPVQLELPAGEGERRVELRVWPSAVLAGGVSLPAGEEPPRDFAAFFRPAPGVSKERAVPAGRAICPIVGKKFTCTVPAGLLDVRAQFQGFVPRYLWGVNAATGKTVQVGTTQLVRGSAVQGFAVMANGAALPRDLKVSLKPAGSQAQTDPAARVRGADLVQTVSINDRGFFEFDAVPPGEYLVEANAEPFAPARVTVRVTHGTVTEVVNPPLTLTEPLMLRAYIDPPLDPWGEPWRLELARLDRASSVFEKEPATRAEQDGSWVGRGLRPGRVWVNVLASRGNPFWTREIELEPSSPPLEIDIPFVKVRGTLRLGQEPLAARLYFGGQHGQIRVEARSNEKGEFTLVLPRRGDWDLAVSAAEPPVERSLRAVAVSPKPGSEEALLSLRLPATVVRGVVENEAGAPVAGANVGLEPVAPGKDLQVFVVTDSRGHFEARGLPPGSLRLEAEADPDLRADIETVEVVEGRLLPPLRLVLRKSLIVEGLVGSQVAAVPGAMVKAQPVGFPFLGVPANTSDSEGRFTLRLPRQTREVHLTVGAPGFALRLLRAAVPEDGPLSVGLDQASGTLIVESQETIVWVAPGPGLYVIHGGAFEGLGYLSLWAYRNGVDNSGPEQRRVVIPFLEPGAYTVCRVDAAARAALDQGVLPAKGCARGQLPANGELTLAP